MLESLLDSRIIPLWPSEGQGKNCDHGEAGTLAQLAQGVSDVLGEAGHVWFVLLGEVIRWARRIGAAAKLRAMMLPIWCGPKPLIVQRHENAALRTGVQSRTGMSGGEQVA